jgi:dipeptidyl aminopeptidase/acylaminoacyl peptidase
MKELKYIWVIIFLLFSAWNPSNFLFAQVYDSIANNPHIYSPDQIDSLLQKPECLIGYFPNQTGYLSKVDSVGKGLLDTTFTIQQIKIPSGDELINGWLYLPLGNEKYPLVVLTNGGETSFQTSGRFPIGWRRF